MASRRDQLESYKFVVQRSLSAFVMRETDPAQSPLRRGVGAAFAGAMIAIIVAAVFAVVGLITKTGSGKWQVEGAVVVEKETGTPFVYRQRTLYPMANYSSALLASGQSSPKTFHESRNSLAKAPRGVTLGIPGAPSSLPDEGKLSTGPWTLCSVTATDQTGRASASTTLILGTTMGGRPLNNDALLAEDILSQSEFLVWHGHRYAITGANTVTSLFGAQTTPVQVTAGWLDGLPTGEAIAPITVANRGATSAVVPGRKVGDVLFARPGNQQSQYYVVLSDGLAAITPLQETIYTGAVAVTPQEIPLADANNAAQSHQLSSAAGPTRAPATPPSLASVGQSGAACMTFSDAHGDPNVAVVTGNAAVTGGVPTAGSLSTGTALANRVNVAPGRAVLVRAMSSPTATAGAYNLVTDLGVRYPVADLQALAALGYTTDRAVDMPSSLVNRIPPGPTLDQSSALLPVPQQVR
jgi:type VII secretion protein EccB